MNDASDGAPSTSSRRSAARAECIDRVLLNDRLPETGGLAAAREDEIDGNAGEDDQHAGAGGSRIAVERVGDDEEADDREDARHDRITERRERPGRVRLARPQHE